MGNLTDDELKERAQDANTVGPRAGEIYRHYKGGLYVVTSRPLREDDLEPLVVYRSNARGTYWARTAVNFTEIVPDGGRDKDGFPMGVPRFTRVEE